MKVFELKELLDKVKATDALVCIGHDGQRPTTEVVDMKVPNVD